MPVTGYINFSSIGLKEVSFYENGAARISYHNDAELIAVIKHYMNKEITVTRDFVFVKGD